jgi:hypothetical protein
MSITSTQVRRLAKTAIALNATLGNPTDDAKPKKVATSRRAKRAGTRATKRPTKAISSRCRLPKLPKRVSHQRVYNSECDLH